MQALDTQADQLRHHLAHLPELAEIATLQASRTDFDNQARDARIVVDDLTGEQAKIDADVEQAKARRKRDQDRIDQGLIPNPKDLEHLQHEMVSLERRISSLEDDELEVMATLEDAQRTLDSVTAQIAAVDERLTQLQAVCAEKRAEAQTQVAELDRQRASLVADLPGDLLALYQKLRENHGGVGASELRQGRCGGCQLNIDVAELDVIRKTPADDVVRCEECSRILVRTSQSGL